MDHLILPDPGNPDFCARCAASLIMRERGGRDRPACPACGWVYYAKPAFGAAVAIEIDGEILLVQRANDPYKGWWMLPAGFVEYEEFAEDSAVREAEEETGLVVELTGLLGVYYGMDDPRNPSHLAVYRARAIGGKLQAGDDAMDAQTFPPDALPEQVAFSGQRRALADWAADLGRRQGTLATAPRFLSFSDAGPAAPVLDYVVIENPRGSDIRLKYDPVTWSFIPTGERLERPMPYHYGWIPRTLSVDGEEMDIWVVDEGRVATGSAIVARPIGIELRLDGDHTVVALPALGAWARPEITEIGQMPDVKRQIETWIRPAVATAEWGDSVVARRHITEAQTRWLAERGT